MIFRCLSVFVFCCNSCLTCAYSISVPFWWNVTSLFRYCLWLFVYYSGCGAILYVCLLSYSIGIRDICSNFLHEIWEWSGCVDNYYALGIHLKRIWYFCISVSLLVVILLKKINNSIIFPFLNEISFWKLFFGRYSWDVETLV